MAYDMNTDYQAIINDSVAKKDYVSAAKAEQSRNEKIAYLDANGLNQYNAVPTYLYQSYLNSGNPGTNGGTVPGTSGEYTAKGTYNDAILSATDQQKIAALKDQYNYYASIGNKEGMDQAHASAEAIRAQYGYSGGGDGSEYYALKMPSGSVPQTTLPTYQANTGQVNSMYDAALEASLAALKSAYETSKFEAEQAMGKISPLYQTQRNATAANAERERMMFNEYAAASGLNSGAGGQAMLAFSNQLQNDLNDLYLGEANALTEAQNQITVLTMKYQNSIAEAVANNEYERAAALLQEFQMQAQSIVEVAQAQASLNLQTAQQNLNAQNSEHDRLSANAETLAKFGDFSGYLALGYSSDQIEQMKAVWKAANPDIAWAVN